MILLFYNLMFDSSNKIFKRYVKFLSDRATADFTLWLGLYIVMNRSILAGIIVTLCPTT